MALLTRPLSLWPFRGTVLGQPWPSSTGAHLSRRRLLREDSRTLQPLIGAGHILSPETGRLREELRVPGGAEEGSALGFYDLSGEGGDTEVFQLSRPENQT